MRYNRIIRHIKWDSNHEYVELIQTMLFELWFYIKP